MNGNDTNMGVAPLDIDLATIDTQRPLLAGEQFYDFIIEKPELKTTKKGGTMATMELKTLAPAQDITGKPLPPGQVVFHNLNMTPSGGAKQDMVNRNMGELLQAVKGGMPMRCTPGNYAQWVPMLQGKMVRARIRVTPETTEASTGRVFKAKNEVAYFVKA